MKYKHIIWDYNGTILDDVELCLEILNYMLDTQNKPHQDIISYREIFGFPIKDYYIRAGFDFEMTSFEELALLYVPMYTKRVSECSTRQGVKKVLDTANELGIKQSILTAAKKIDVTVQLKNLGILDSFAYISGLDDDYASSKVHLIPGHIEQIDCGIDEILFVGDTDHDAAVADKIGCDCALLTNGHQSDEILHSTGKKVFSDVDELMEIIVNG